MNTITVTTDIDAPAEVVYEVLTDFAAYPAWNDYTRIDGVAAEGERLAVSPGPAAGSAPTFRPRVLRADGAELRWLGHLWVPGLFDGEHRFRVETVADDRSRLVQDERFRGLLAGLLVRRYGDDWRANFAAVNEALRTRAEALAAADSAVEHDAAA
ncbi:SRPBCC domain-containing protein [Halobaculum lipolyticum]|uniref:SRPBCC family protein n=1 Tax=Halobaculum lipolyticum TaxID=3032001 RepID=A0ABD5WB71_9EURY|nr:SRPBCC domain-containing protein [Halobaculum sp. DT31]